jgi:hypothetical protein
MPVVSPMSPLSQVQMASVVAECTTEWQVFSHLQGTFIGCTWGRGKPLEVLVMPWVVRWLRVNGFESFVASSHL